MEGTAVTIDSLNAAQFRKKSRRSIKDSTIQYGPLSVLLNVFAAWKEYKCTVARGRSKKQHD